MGRCTFDYFEKLYVALEENEKKITREILEEMDHSNGYELKQIDIKNGILHYCGNLTISELILAYKMLENGIDTKDLKSQLLLCQIIRSLPVPKARIPQSNTEVEVYKNLIFQKNFLNEEIKSLESSFSSMLNRNYRNSVYYDFLINALDITEHEIRMKSNFFKEKKESLEWLFNSLNEDDQFAICKLAIRLAPPNTDTSINK